MLMPQGYDDKAFFKVHLGELKLGMLHGASYGLNPLGCRRPTSEIDNEWSIPLTREFEYV